MTAPIKGNKNARRALAKKRPTAVLNMLPIVLLIKPAMEKPKMLSKIAPNIPPGIAKMAPIMAQIPIASLSPANKRKQIEINPNNVIIVCV